MLDWIGHAFRKLCIVYLHSIVIKQNQFSLPLRLGARVSQLVATQFFFWHSIPAFGRAMVGWVASLVAGISNTESDRWTILYQLTSGKTLLLIFAELL